tara:strand:- start:203 stop:619 length:417 start_codon:yes stop_codon:yes gene_type:complete
MPKNINKIEARKKKVLEAKLKDPTKSERDIGSELNIGKSTVHRDLVFLGQDGALQEDTVINSIKDADLEIVTLGQAEIVRRFRAQEELEKMSTRDVSIVSKDSQVRYSFLSGENAKKNGGEIKREVTVVQYGDVDDTL